MALKAKEKVKQLSFSAGWYIAILAVVIYIVFFFRKTVALFPENFQQPFTIGFEVLTLILFLYLLVYTSLFYVMVLSHKELEITRCFLFFHWNAARLQCKDFLDIVPEKKYEGSVRPKNYTIHRMDGFAKYVVTYREKGEIRAAKIQCRRKFYNEMVELVELNKKVAENAAKKKTKNKKK